MDVRGAVMSGIARQLGHPSGLRGRFVGAVLNRRNRRFVSAAVHALAPDAGAVVADVGFGGGVGLKILLDGVGQSGQVHGVEVSETMLNNAEHRYRRDIAAGRLHLHTASMTRLPIADDALDGAVTVNTIYFIPELDPAFTEFARVVRSSGRIVIGLADPEVMAKMPFTAHGFHLRPVPELIDALRGAGLTVQRRRIGQGDNAFHLLIATHCTPPV